MLPEYPRNGGWAESQTDGTFEFGMSYGAADLVGEGKMDDARRRGLSQHDDERRASVQLVRSSATSRQRFALRRDAWRSRPGVPNIDVALVTKRGKTEARTDSEGIAMFQKEDAPLKAAFLDWRLPSGDELYELNSAHDDFTFEMNGPGISELRFSDERFVVNGRRWFRTTGVPIRKCVSSSKSSGAKAPRGLKSTLHE